MILLTLVLLCIAIGVFIYIKHKQADRELQRRERLEEKQEQLIEILRKRNSGQDDEVSDTTTGK